MTAAAATGSTPTRQRINSIRPPRTDTDLTRTCKSRFGQGQPGTRDQPDPLHRRAARGADLPYTDPTTAAIPNSRWCCRWRRPNPRGSARASWSSRWTPTAATRSTAARSARRMPALAQALREAARRIPTGGETVLVISADENSSHQAVIRVMDAGAAAGSSASSSPPASRRRHADVGNLLAAWQSATAGQPCSWPLSCLYAALLGLRRLAYRIGLARSESGCRYRCWWSATWWWAAPARRRP